MKNGRLPVLKTYKLFIDGKFPRSESGRSYACASKGETIANVCLSSRKDLRDAVVAARKAFPGWAARAPFNRGQILYRIAEVLESRREEFVGELILQGESNEKARREVSDSIDRLVYFAGWADKFQQVMSCVNPVSAPYFNFSSPEPTGVVGIIAPNKLSLLGIVSSIAPVIAGGNTAIVLASETNPLSAITFAEVLHSSDVPAGVVNVLTGTRKELLPHFASHMDINGVMYWGEKTDEIKLIEESASLNVKRISCFTEKELSSLKIESPYPILDFQEIKTTWHPIGA